MEALVAVGLASNIVGFLDVASKFCAAVNEIYDKGQTFRNQECAVITQDLFKVCGDLTHSVTVAPSTGTSSGSNQRIISLAARCSILANVLLGKLQGLVVPPNSGRGTVLRQALKGAWKRSEIEHHVHQLQEYRQELALDVLTELRAECLTQTQLSTTLDIALRPLENTISVVETRLSTVIQSLRAELSDVTTKLDGLAISQNNIDTGIQSLHQQSTDSQKQIAAGFQLVASQQDRHYESLNHNVDTRFQSLHQRSTYSHKETVAGFQMVASRQERHYESLNRHLRLQTSQLERLRFSTEGQSTHVVGDERSLTAFMFSENNTIIPAYLSFKKSAQFAIKDFCAECHNRSSSSAARPILHAESEALQFVEKSLTTFMTNDAANNHSATFSSNAISHCAGLGTIMLQVVRREPFPRCQQSNTPNRGWKSFTASLTLITPANVASRGLKFAYDYHIDTRGPLSLLTPIHIFNIIPDGDLIRRERYSLGSRYDCTADECSSFRTGVARNFTLVECLFLHRGRGYTPFDRDSSGQTPLHYAALSDTTAEAYAACEYLIGVGADISTSSRHVETPFHLALFRLMYRIEFFDLDDGLSDLQASEKLLRLLWSDCQESPDTAFAVVLTVIREFSIWKYRSKKPGITRVVEFLSHLEFSEWEGLFVAYWLQSFDALTYEGRPRYNRESLVSLVTDVFTFCPPTFEILYEILHAVELQGATNEDSCSTTDSVEYDYGVVELARIYIRGGGQHLYFYEGTLTTLSEFARIGFDDVWCILVEEEAGIPADQYRKESERIAEACDRREEEITVRTQEQLRRQEEHARWREQDKRREMESERRMEEEVRLTNEDIMRRWTEEDERCVEEDTERRDARQRWACENKRWGQEDSRRKEEKKAWNHVPKKSTKLVNVNDQD